jgi:hypothetical protein
MRIGYLRWPHASRTVDRNVVGRDEFWNVRHYLFVDRIVSFDIHKRRATRHVHILSAEPT